MVLILVNPILESLLLQITVGTVTSYNNGSVFPYTGPAASETRVFSAGTGLSLDPQPALVTQA